MQIARVVMCNHAAYALGDVCAAVVAAAIDTTTLPSEVTDVIDTCAQVRWSCY